MQDSSRLGFHLGSDVRYKLDSSETELHLSILYILPYFISQKLLNNE